MQGSNATTDFVHLAKISSNFSNFLSDLKSHFIQNADTKVPAMNSRKQFPVSPSNHCSALQMLLIFWYYKHEKLKVYLFCVF